MTMPKIDRLTGHVCHLPRRDVDTDQIIPARFLTTTTKDGLGSAAFHDWRFDGDDTPRDTDPFKQRTDEQTILVAGDNFGCGSSREHAPWALHAFGFRAVLAPSIADIFRSNALKNGLLAIEIGQSSIDTILSVQERPLSIDLEAQTIHGHDVIIPFDVDPFAKHLLLTGQDALGLLVDAIPETERFEKAIGQ